ncbi:S-type anion channel SLAH2-like [Nicotiana sylvestris]|uniref:S-type anion channel SLAH2-like n=1 Tax=Nicotiana sylvestris TaxID=4096 RepID=A0A1U7YSU4_NICSY|nr:PREDICTED: S-type anion channel SLAH2-like [Nicotiana sylvestris]XP_009805002.1 PREDICTED: S-type anion channel SLAH2-like [Nicotiana sylvestris]XP_009805003.1 PREDICTED: S-type anion channel SLAH2-like [Nicotiana sylvestris]
METSEQIHTEKEASAEGLPSLIRFISSEMDHDFDSIVNDHIKNQTAPAPESHFPSSSIMVSEFAAERESDRIRAVSISMPPSPKKVVFTDDTKDTPDSAFRSKDAGSNGNKKTRFYSQPMPTGTTAASGAPASGELPRNPRISKLKDKRYDSFKTFSGRLERQLSNLRGNKNQETEQESISQPSPELEINIPVDRYFDALEGPELDKLRASEESVLPEDKTWPFLLRFPISSFGIILGVSSQAIMWKALATSATTKFLHISLDVNLVLWCISVALMAIVSFTYALKIIFYFEAVRREYYHPIRVNFFFAPWIALLFLALGLPPTVYQNLPEALWYVLMTPFLCLELKIYGQWMSGGQRRLSKVANPSNHLSVVGNFVGSLLGATMGLKEGAIFFFAVGLAHYTVLFVTLYQRLPTNETLPKDLHPVFFLFVAAPSVASMAWANIQGSFDFGARIAYFIALFLYFSLAVRINFFRGFRFSLAWWAYTFPMTGAAIATIRYSNVVNTVVTKILVVILCTLSTLTVTALLVTTIIHAFVLRDLFPNDISIAISERRPKTHRRWYHHRRAGSTDIDQFLKYADSAEAKDIEAALSSIELTTSATKEVSQD